MTADTHSLRTQFKVKTSKQHARSDKEEEESPHHLPAEPEPGVFSDSGSAGEVGVFDVLPGA